ELQRQVSLAGWNGNIDGSKEDIGRRIPFAAGNPQFRTKHSSLRRCGLQSDLGRRARLHWEQESHGLIQRSRLTADRKLPEREIAGSCDLRRESFICGLVPLDSWNILSVA